MDVKKDKPEDVAVCQSIYDAIKQTPDFFKRFQTEGYYYILADSPFKHRRIERINPAVVLVVALQNFLRDREIDIAYQLDRKKGFRRAGKRGLYSTGALKEFAYEWKIVKENFYDAERKYYDDPIDEIRKQQDARDRFFKAYIINNDVFYYDGIFEVNPDFFAYRIKSNFYNRWDFDEYTIGIIDSLKTNKVSRMKTEYHVVDKYMQPHPKIRYNDYLSKDFPFGSPGSSYYYSDVHQEVPINVNGRSYSATIEEFFGNWYVFVQKRMWKGNYPDLDPYFCNLKISINSDKE